MSEDNKWHFRKTIDAGHLTTTIALTLGAFWYFADLDKRIALLEAPQEERTYRSRARQENTGARKEIIETHHRRPHGSR